MSISPQAKALAEAMAQQQAASGDMTKELHSGGVEADRAAFNPVAIEHARPKLKCLKVENITVPSKDPNYDVPVRVYWPFEAADDKSLPAIVYVHGGGWCIGSLETHDSMCREVCVRAGMVVASVDYRLAPEAKFPTAPEDCAAAIRHLRANPETFGIDAERIGISGDSAGANIAAGVALMAKDDPSIKLAAQFLHYGLYNARRDFLPDARVRLGSDESFQPSQRQIHAVLDHYCRDEADRDNPIVSPLLADDLTGLCPASITAGGYDPMCDDSKLYAKKLRDAGIPCDFRCWVSMIHGYYTWADVLDLTEECFAHFVEQAKELLGCEDAGAGMQHLDEKAFL